MLKDEVLNNSNWNREKFDSDLRMATTVDLSAPELHAVRTVEVILAYNKDEDANGQTLFDRFAKAMEEFKNNGRQLTFDRWNLTTLVERVSASLLTPSLLPQKFFSLFSYICSQFADFTHGSVEWERQLVPNWKRFLADLLVDTASERSVRMVPVALIILRKSGEANPSLETGWIDLMEWAVLAVSDFARRKADVPLARLSEAIWSELYISELARYFAAHDEELSLAESLDRPRTGSPLDSIASSVVAHWHLGRLGILTLDAEFQEFDREETRSQMLTVVANWAVGLIDANRATLRPIIDLHHVELLLTWRTFVSARRRDVLVPWLGELTSRLVVRRPGQCEIPFIEGRNNIAAVLSHVADQERPYVFDDASSTYLLSLLAVACSLDSEQKGLAIDAIYSQLVLDPCCEDGSDHYENQIDLMLWLPPSHWQERILSESLADQGCCVAVHLQKVGAEPQPTAEEIGLAIEALLVQVEPSQPSEPESEKSFAKIALGCLKHSTPLPWPLWLPLAMGR